MRAVISAMLPGSMLRTALALRGMLPPDDSLPSARAAARETLLHQPT
jgi:hypothetical protein